MLAVKTPIDNLIDALKAINGNSMLVSLLNYPEAIIDRGKLFMELRHDLEDALKIVKTLEEDEA